MDAFPVPKIDDIQLESKRVLVRVDFNVPLDGRKVVDDTRIRAALPTINLISERGGRLVLMSHLGRPKGKHVPELSLEPIAARLAELLEIGEVTLTDSCVGDGARRVVLNLRDGQVALLENLRFHAGETVNDDKFARELASLADVFVNDAFGAAHRAHASTVGVVGHVHERAAGLLLTKEIAALSKLLGSVERPYTAVLGGAKVSDKIGIIENLLARIDVLIIGGAMANTFVAAAGRHLGASLVEANKLPLARSIMNKAEAHGVRILLPTDFVVADSADAENAQVVFADEVQEGQMAFDVGPQSMATFRELVGRAGTIFWNGPLGMFEKPRFAEGTIAMARAIVGSAAFSVVGGGDSVSAIRNAGLEHGFDHVSTGGGASLEFLEGKILPGIEALSKLPGPRS